MFVKNESGKIKLILNEKITREEGGVILSSKKVTKSEVYSNYFSLFPFKKQYFLFPSIITSSNSWNDRQGGKKIPITNTIQKKRVVTLIIKYSTYQNYQRMRGATSKILTSETGGKGKTGGTNYAWKVEQNINLTILIKSQVSIWRSYIWRFIWKILITVPGNQNISWFVFYIRTFPWVPCNILFTIKAKVWHVKTQKSRNQELVLDMYVQSIATRDVSYTNVVPLF